MIDKKVKRAIVTAAGFGSRFLPITKTIPKEMLPIIDKPIVHCIVEECIEAEIEEVIIVVAPGEIAKFEDYFYGNATNIRTMMSRQGKIERWDKVEKIFRLPKITIMPQDDRLPYGNGRPVLTAKDLVIHDEAFVVIFGDDMVLSKVSATKQIVDFYHENTCDGVLAVQELPESELHLYGMVKLKEGSSDQIDFIVEKPEAGKSPSNLASYGRYVLTPRVFEYLTESATGKDSELWLQDANDKVAHSGKMLVKVVDGEWMTTGDPLRYMQCHLKHMLANEKYADDLRKFLATL